MVAKSRDAASELAANLVRVLESQRSLGSSAYPLPLRRLAELTDASAPPEPLQPALKKKPFKDRVVCGHTKHPNAPVAFVEDLDQLAASPLLLEFALELREDTLDRMGDIGIGVGQVADDLQHAPSPDDGRRDHLLAANAGNGRPEYPGAGEIGVEQGGLFHLGFLRPG